jgi:NADPH2:quinone reductase
MKALLSRQAGGPESLVLEDVAEPAAGPGQVKVAVRACGVNFPDLLIIQDQYQTKPQRPFIPGGEIAGVVEAVGERVDKVRPGDRVLMSPVSGGMAQRAVGPAANCWKIPDAMPFDEAAALLLTYGTSQHARSPIDSRPPAAPSTKSVSPARRCARSSSACWEVP